MDLTRLDFERWDLWTYPIVQALLYSISIHIAVFVMAEAGHRLGWWEITIMPSWMATAITKKIAPEKPSEQSAGELMAPDVPLLYVEVNPNQVSSVSPQEAKFASSANSVANRSEPTPSPRQSAILRPAMAPAVPQSAVLPPRMQMAPREMPAVSPKGDLIIGTPSTETNAAVQPKMGTSARLRARNSPTTMETVKKGTPRLTMDDASLDAAASPFGEYDLNIIGSIKQHWLNLLEQDDYVRGNTGKVVLEFRMHADGRITNLRVTENQVTDVLSLICQRAVLAPVPYRPWPLSMRRALSTSYREVRFTFHYE